MKFFKLLSLLLMLLAMANRATSQKVRGAAITDTEKGKLKAPPST